MSITFFKRTAEKLTQPVNKAKLMEAFDSAGLSDEVQATIKLAAFEDYPIEAGIRITKIRS